MEKEESEDIEEIILEDDIQNSQNYSNENLS